MIAGGLVRDEKLMKIGSYFQVREVMGSFWNTYLELSWLRLDFLGLRLTQNESMSLRSS
jgi:hypothetical protein